MGKIRILPDSIANKIAAGEVVERPASVVKELLENSLDAGAGQVRIDVEAGGKRAIRVVDDGCGMGRDDALLAFERHATSKLRQAEDLLSVATLGFRGEALPSIAAVSRLTLETRSTDERVGTRVEVHGGRMLDVKDVGLAPGTTVTVRDLFHNLPARRKFLRSEPTEMAHIASLVTHYALAHPERGFVLASSTGDLLNVSPVASLRERFYQVFGAETLEQMVELDQIALPVGISDEAGTSEQKIILSGFISRPQIQKQNRNSVFLFVNRRLIRDRLLWHALGEAYRNVIPPGTYPVALLFLELPYQEVDVNVHPAKTEVRFRQQTIVHDFLREALRERLAATRPVSTFPVAAAAPTLQPVFTLEPPRLMPEPRRFEFTSPAPPSEPPQAATVVVEAPPGVATATAMEPWAAAAAPDLSSLRPLGQLQESFIIAASPEGLWIIDQHVAHERILFEQLLKKRNGRERLEGQQLLMPYILRLTPAQQATFEGIRAELEANGFEIEPFGHSTLAVKASPAGVGPSDIDKLLRELLDNLEPVRSMNLEDVQRRVAATVACHAAIKINTPLQPRKMEWLLDELSRAECPMSCPHGRPIVLKYSMREILKAFHRI